MLPQWHFPSICFILTPLVIHNYQIYGGLCDGVGTTHVALLRERNCAQIASQFSASPAVMPD